VLGLFKMEVIRHSGPWKGIGDVEIATLGRAWWSNHQRFPERLGYRSPAEDEAQHALAQAAGTTGHCRAATIG
jgi:putative transposase